jgi:protein-S-isoprenylcysteine O-methyltransferase Ste14
MLEQRGSMLKAVSLVSFLLMVAALIGLIAIGSLFSPAPAAIAVQCGAVALMLWARMTFGGRSFHATANPTAGGLVTTGPFHYIRHPIYTAGCLIGWAGVFAHLSAESVALGLLLFAGGLGRMLCEERLVAETYPEYREYARVTKRMIPFVF